MKILWEIALEADKQRKEQPMPFIVEQVQSDGTIVEDYDQTISVKKLYERIQRYFPEIYHGNA